MSLSGDGSPDERFSCALAAYDDALAVGKSSLQEDTLTCIEPELLFDLRSAQACLDLLEQKWPRSQRRLVSEFDADPFSIFWAGIPRELGRFQLQRKVGVGGHGVVLLAYDSVLRRPVALKLPRPDALLTPSVRRRFLREARACAGLTHPNLISVYDAGEAGPLCYIAEAYCDGPTLSAWLRQQSHPIDPRLAAEIIRTLADAVDYAHRCGIVHRDLKPGNVLLEPKRRGDLSTPSSERVSTLVAAEDFQFTLKLTDFGLAKLSEVDATQNDSATVVGTVPYMAPEQAGGKREEIGPRTDIYALGVSLFELLTRQTPFAGENTADTLRRILGDEPAPLRRLRSDVSADLEAICWKCLEKSPDDRYASAHALAEDLSRFLDGQPTQARPLGRLQRGLKWSRRRPAAAGLIAVSTLAIITILIGGWWHAATLQTALTFSERMRQEAETQRGEANSRRQEALKHQVIARERERRVREYLYAADTRLALAAWKSHHVREAVDLLSRHLPTKDDDDLRTFAWHYLWRLCHLERVTFRGHQGRVYGVAYSPDGKLLATASTDGTAKLWDVTTGREVATCARHAGGDVNAVAFAPDGKSFATAGDDRTVRIWDTNTGQLRTVCTGHGEDVLAVAFSPDGTIVASGSVDKLVKLWNSATGQERGTLRGHSGWIRGLAFSPNGTQLVSASNDGAARIWDPTSGKVETTLRRHVVVPILSIAFSHDGRQVATGDDAKCVTIWDAATGVEKESFANHDGAVRRLEFSPDDRYLMAAAHNGAVSFRDLATGKVRNTIRGHTDKLWCATLSPDGRTLATGSEDQTAKVWNAETLQEHRSFTGIPIPVARVVFSSTGSHLVGVGVNSTSARSKDRTVTFRVWDTSTGGECRKFRRDGEGMDPVLAANAKAAAFVALPERRSPPPRRVMDYALPDQWRFARFEFPVAEHPTQYALSCDGRTLASGDQQGKIGLWDLASGQRRATLQHLFKYSISILEFSEDGKLLAFVDDHGITGIGDVATQQVCARLAGHGGDAYGVCFAPDDKTVATAGSDHTIKLWNLADSAELATLAGHEGAVRCVAFSPDGKTLASGSDAGTVRLWDVRTSQELGSLDAHKGGVKTVAFSPEGKTLASGGGTRDGKGEVFLWTAVE